MYPVTNPNPLTKLQFAVEELYNYYIKEPEAKAEKEKSEKNVNA